MLGAICTRSLTLLLVFAGPALARGIACEDSSSRKCGLEEKCYSIVQRCDGKADCSDHSDEKNCTDADVTRQYLLREGRQSSSANFAWLVTPILFSLGVLYAIYKCFKDGICHIRRLQRNRRLRRHTEDDNESLSYAPLDRVQFYAMTRVPASQVAGHAGHVMLIRSHCDGGCGQFNGLVPPTYDEAMGYTWRGALSTVDELDSELPPYSEFAQLPDEAIDDNEDEEGDADTCHLLERHNSNGALHAYRHRHRSADTHRHQRHLGMRSGDVNRQRHRSEPSKALH